MPKYWKKCGLQGYDEILRCNIHPELHETQIEKNKGDLKLQVNG